VLLGKRAQGPLFSWIDDIPSLLAIVLFGAGFVQIGVSPEALQLVYQQMKDD
jgi:hypothetical protein